MGLFTRDRRRTAPALADWLPDGAGVQDGGPEVGGDVQVGRSYAVRFVNADLPGALIDLATYVISYAAVENEPAAYYTELTVEWIICYDPSDPGGTEWWSESRAWQIDCAGQDWDAAVDSVIAMADDIAGEDGSAWLYGVFLPRLTETDREHIANWDGQPW